MSLADKRTPPHMLSGPEQKKARSSWKGNAESDTSSGNRRHGSVTEDVKNTLESKVQKFKFLSRALSLAKKPLEEKTPKVDKLSTSLPGQQKDSDAAAAIMGRTKNTPIIIIEDEETNPSTPVSESVETSCAHNQSLREEGYGNAAEPWIDGGASEETSCARNEREEGYGDAAETRIDGGACHGEELVAESSLPGLQKDSDAAAVIIGRTKTMPIIIIEDEETNPSAHPSESAIDHQMKESGGTSCAQNQSLREEGYGGAAGTRIDGGACHGRELVAETLADINRASSDMEISDDDTPCGRETEENEGKEQILPVDDDGNLHASSAMEDDDTPCGQETEDNKGNEQIHPDDDGNQHASGDMVISDDDTPCGRETEDNEGNEQILPVDDDGNQHGETEVEYEDEVGEIEEDEENGQIGNDGDGLEDIWNEMYFSLECSKDRDDTQPKEQVQVKIPDCDHCFVLKEDLGSVCRVCGVIEKGIQDIIEYQYQKRTKSSRTYYREAGVSTDKEAHELINRGSNSSVLDMPIEGLAIHPRHRKQMKPHQLEGFKFLLNNLVSDNPGGCILAHAPGSGKTFMIISFMQSFLAKYPEAKPLVVLPKGILSSWKKEFTRWQVENIPLYDFYTAKADSRAQQLEVLKQWTGHRSILFLGYMQLSSIICDDESNETTAACQKILLEYPSILILDEGHTPRNEETDVLASLKKVQTPRKVVLSGTLYQNHVKEVFNIFDLVRPKFLKQENSRAIMRRILSRVPHGRKQGEANNIFYESVETTLQKDEDFERKITVIRDLREMTSKVLHFYKGDFLDELPGLEDFTVFLNLSPKQKAGVNELKKLTQRFRIISEGSQLYVHPELRKHLNTSTKKEKDGLDFGKMDAVIEKSEIRDGVKANFFLNLLGLCETTQEKLLVFSQYIQPLKFLERLVVKKKNWSVGKEIFMITGDSSSGSRDSSMEQFNNSSSAKLFFGSIKACGEGISLVGGSRIIILDVHLNPSVTRQAIGRAFRPGQEKKVYTYRLVAAESPEEDDHATCYRKESISKMWFEWNECCRKNEFEMQPMDVKDCGDEFLESPMLSSDVKSLYKR